MSEMSLRFRAITFLATSVLLFGMLGRISFLEKKVYQTELAKDSVEAVNSKTVRTLQGNLATASRRIVQTELKNDSLSKALKTESKVRASLAMKLDSVKGTVTTVVVRDSATIKLDFPSAYQQPVTIKADGDINLATNLATLSFKIDIDPFNVGLDIGCGDPVNNVRPATITLVTPKFVTVSVDTVKQSKDVCSPRPAPTIRIDMGVKKSGMLIGVGAILGAATYWYFNRGEK